MDSMELCSAMGKLAVGRHLLWK